MRNIVIVAALAASFSGAAMSQETSAPLCLAFGEPSVLTEITFETADTEAQRRQGLMFRESIPRRHGMLFRYEVPQAMSFWMKDTYIPLDIIFMDQDWTVKKIHENAKPHDKSPIYGADRGEMDNLRQYVLELNAGEAKEIGAVVGSVLMRHECIGATQAER